MSVWHPDLPAAQHERAAQDGAAILTALTKGVSVTDDHTAALHAVARIAAAIHALARSAAIILLPGPGCVEEDQDELGRKFAELVRWYISSESRL